MIGATGVAGVPMAGNSAEVAVVSPPCKAEQATQVAWLGRESDPQSGSRR